jgi:hypothetical protein
MQRENEYNYYKKTTCLDNIVCLIDTNLNINIKKLNNLIGGQLSSSLPAIRYVINIDGYRYVILIYSTGKIILTNLFFLNDMLPIYKYFYDFTIFLLYINVASFKTLNQDLDWDQSLFNYSCRDKCLKEVDEEFQISFLIVNCAFSVHLNELYFKRKYKILDDQENPNRSLNLASLNHLFNYLIENIGKIGEDLKFMKKNSEALFKLNEQKNFPADIIKLISIRSNYDKLCDVKSLASKKRKKNNFYQQTTSIHIFKEGKLSFTGAQTKDDVEHIFLILETIFNYFFI